MKTRFTLLTTFAVLVCFSFSSCVSVGKQFSRSQALPDNTEKNSLKRSTPDSYISMDDSAGVVYITVNGEMLFQPGSVLVDPRAKRALEPLGKLLYYGDENFRIVIKGDVNSDEVVQARFVDDWSLSQARANTIMRILVQSAALEQKAEARRAKSTAEPVEEMADTQQQTDTVKTNGKQYVLVLISSL